jgi:hypothetical protein
VNVSDPELMCDALADLADLADFYVVKAPAVFNAPPGFVPAFIHLHAVQLTDYGFLRAVDTQLAVLTVRNTVAPVYSATETTANGARHMGHVEGVRKSSRRLTVADKLKIENTKWGVV